MNRVFILLMSLCMLINLHAQEVSEKMEHADCMGYRNTVIVAGYEQKGNELFLRVKRYDESGTLVSWAERSLGKARSSEFYAPQGDTTHGLISFVLQRSNNDKQATLIRFNEQLKQVNYLEKTEITHINSFAAFDHEKLYYKNNLYMVREAKDSAASIFTDTN